jgi:hypothetical protein
MNYFLSIFILILLTGCGKITVQEEVFSEPKQKDLVGAPILNLKNCSIEKKAEYQVTAIVLGKKEYDDMASELIPIDMVLGWQKMSNQVLIDKLDISQSNRWYYYSFNEPMDYSDISNYSANTHIIPLNDAILKKVEDIEVGQKVFLKGYLVNVTIPGKNGWTMHFNSSLSRIDTGAGACEVFLVEDVII